MWIFRRSKVYRNPHVRTSILRTFTLLGDNLDTCTCTCIVFVLELNNNKNTIPTNSRLLEWECSLVAVSSLYILIFYDKIFWNI